MNPATGDANHAAGNYGSSEAGTGSTLTFTDPAPTGAQGFYQILVSP